jgi:hypothetical protein
VALHLGRYNLNLHCYEKFIYLEKIMSSATNLANKRQGTDADPFLK